MSFLLDTCLVSELVRKQPNPAVLAWLEKQQERDLFLSVLTFGELQKGIVRLPESPKRKRLQQWIERELKQRFAGRIMNIDYEVATLAGQLQGTLQSEEFTLPAIDSLIAATAMHNGLVVVTRNETAMNRCKTPVLNPWEIVE